HDVQLFVAAFEAPARNASHLAGRAVAKHVVDELHRARHVDQPTRLFFSNDGCHFSLAPTHLTQRRCLGKPQKACIIREHGKFMGERYPRWTYVVIFALLVIVAVLSVRALRGKNGQTTAITPEKAAPGDQKAQRDGENDRRIEELNNEIAAVRKENEANAARVRELEAQLADSSKALAAAQQKLKVAQRQAERPPIASAREKNLSAKTPAAPAPSQPPPAQTQTAQAPPAQAPPPPQPQRRV